MKQKKINRDGYIRELHAQGLYAYEIADKMNVSVKTVCRALGRTINLKKNLFKDYCDIWRSYLDLGVDMTTDDMNSAILKLTEKYGLKYPDATVHYISKAMNDELTPVEFALTKAMKGYDYYIQDQRLYEPSKR